jgi:hypothetical protein
MTQQNSSPGFNGEFIWFTAVVENVNDPRQLGRLRCRIIGKDSASLSQQPSDQLPWFMTMRPLTGTHASLDVKPGDYVSGFFLDGKACQVPVVSGVYPGVQRAVSDTTIGFSPQLTPEEISNTPNPPLGISALTDVGSVTGSPKQTRGVLRGTLIERTNAEVVHVCDIATQLRRSVIWESLKHSQFVSKIREGIQALITLLGYNPDSLSQRVVDTIKFIRRKLKNLQDLIEEFNNWAELSIGIARKFRELVDWILSLPERIKKQLENCLTAFLSGISSLVSDTLSLPDASGSNVENIVGEIKQTISQAQSTLQSGLNTITIPAKLVDAVLTPTSITDSSGLPNIATAFIESQIETNQSAINTVNINERQLA